MKRRSLLILLALCTAAVSSYAQVLHQLSGPVEASLCETVTLTNSFINVGDPLSGLIFTQRLPGTDFVYVPSNSIISLPDGSTLTNAAADPGINDGTNLVWDFSALAGTSTVNHLLLTEVFYHTTNTDTAAEKGFQWIEIYNPMLSPVDVTGWYIEDTAPGIGDALPAFTINPGEFVIIAGRTNDFYSDYPTHTGRVFEVADGDIGSGLNHFGDGVILFNAGASRVDAMSYGSSKLGLDPAIPTVAATHSIARDPANEDSNSRTDWVDQTVPDPGFGNVVVGIMGGEEVRLQYDLEIACDAISAQFISRATYEQPPGGDTRTNESSVFITINHADLTVRKSPLKQAARFDDLVEWEVTIENNGFGSAHDVVMSDILGTGMVFAGFSVLPTNSMPYGNTVQWDKTVIPEFSNLAAGAVITVTVTGQVISCKGLFNNAEATWGCYNFVATTNQTCQDTSESGGTLKAGIDFQNYALGVSGEILESEPINVAYCDGSFVTVSLTNAYSTNYTYAFDIELIPFIPDGFGIVGLNSNGNIWVGDLAPGQQTNILVQLVATNGCDTPENELPFSFIADYRDICGIAYSPPSLLSSLILSDIPEAEVTKVMPGTLSGDATSMTVQVLFSYENFSTTAVSVVDTYPSDARWYPTNVTQSGVINGGNITWSNLEFTGSGVFTAEFDMVMNDRCDVPAGMNYNIIAAPDYTDCQGCVRPVLGSGEAYGVYVYPGDGCSPPDPGTGDCTFASAKIGPSLVEACSPASLQHTFSDFTGPNLPTSWTGAVFESDLAASNGYLYSTGTVMVVIDGSNVTPYVTITQTNAPFTIDLTGLSDSSFPSPSTVTSGLEFYWDVVMTNAGRVIDGSRLTLQPCGRYRETIEWNVGESLITVDLAAIQNNDACGIAYVHLDLDQLPSPEILAGENRIFPTYDVEIVLDLDADGDGLYSYDYVTNTTAFSNMIALGGGAIPSSEPTVDSNFLSWTVGDIETNGAGEIYFALRAGCESYTNQSVAAYALFNNQCEDGLPQQRIHYGPTNSLLPYFSANLHACLEPEFTFLIDTQYVTEIKFINSGAGVAFNVNVAMTKGTNLTYGSASAPPTSTSASNIYWDLQFTNAYQGLTDEDGDGYYDDLKPNACFSIFVTNYVTSCGTRDVYVQGWTGCKGETCNYSEIDVATYEVGQGSLVTRATFPVSGVLCETNTVLYEVRNSGLSFDYDVSVFQILPGGMSVMTDSFRYVYNETTNLTAVPSGSGTLIDPYVWDDSLIPAFTELEPTGTVLILYEVYIACDAVISNEQFIAQGEYTDNCGDTYVNRQVISFAGVEEPELNITKRASLDGTNFTTQLVSADLGNTLVYELTIDHTGASETEVNALDLTDILPFNVTYTGASLPPDSAIGQTLYWSSTNLMSVYGGPPYYRTNDAISITVTGIVNDCAPDTNNISIVNYGCNETNMCLTDSATHQLRTLPVNNVNSEEALSLKTCGGFKNLSISNSGSTAHGLLITESAPAGYYFTGASVTGAFYGENLIIADWGSPSGSIVTIDFTTTNSSGAIDLSHPAESNLLWRNGEILDLSFSLISAGDNLDCVADPTDNNFEDPGYGDPTLVTSVSTMIFDSACGGAFTNTDTSSVYPLLPNPNIDLQPNSLVVTNGEQVTMTVTMINQTEGGAASNLAMRVRLGPGWSNVSIVDTQLSALSGAVITELVGNTNLLINLPGVNMRPYTDEVILTFQGTVVEGPGDLRVLAEVVGDCANNQIIPSCVFSNTLGEAPLADTMTGSIQPSPIDGEYYAFDQDMSVFAGFSLEKTVRYDDEDPVEAGDFRDARIGEGMIYNIEAHYFGDVFSNLTIIESLPTNLVFADSADFTNTYSGDLTNAIYSGGIFTLQPITISNGPSVFTVDIPVILSNGWQNQQGVSFSNTATAAFDMSLFTNAVPVSTTTVDVVEPYFSIDKSVNSNEVQWGDIVEYTIVITNTGATNGYSVEISDTLPSGLAYVTSTPPAQLSGQVITLTTNEDATLADIAVDGTYTYTYQALVTNQIIGATVYNDAEVTWTSLDAASENSQMRDGSDGVSGLNDYINDDSTPITARDIQGIAKSYVSSSQTNTLGSNTFTIGERVIYDIRVDMPQGVAPNVDVRDLVPQGMDWVGPNTNTGLSWPGYGYQFTVPGGGPTFPQTTNDGLVISDPDPTPYTSLNNDGSGADITFTFGAITNIADGNPNNDYFVLSMELVILDDPFNTGLLPTYTIETNGAEVTDDFVTLSDTAPPYGVAEHDVRIRKDMNPTSIIASNIVTVSMVVSNTSSARSAAYDISADDFFPVEQFNAGTISEFAVPDGWATSNHIDAAGVTHYFFTTNTTALQPDAAFTNVFTIQVAQTVEPNALYTNRAAITDSTTLYGTPPGGIPERNDTAAGTRTYSVPGFSLDKYVYATSETNIPPDSTNWFVQIGEVITYQLDVTLPESTITNLTVVDVIPDGLSYVNGSATTDVSSFVGDLPAMSVTPVVGGQLAGDGVDMTFTFLGNTICAGDNENTTDTFAIFFDALVLDTNSNSGLAPQTILTNIASVTYAADRQPPVQSGITTNAVIEPVLEIFKDMTPTNIHAGDVLSVTFTATNSGSATAYDILITDVFDSSFDASTINNVVLPTGFVHQVIGDTLTIFTDTNAPTGTNSIEVGETLDFTFDITVSQSVFPNTYPTNIVTIIGDSLASTNVFDEQRYTGDTNEVVLKVLDFTFYKSIYATSETGPADSTTNDVQIGEVVTFELDAVLPSGTITNLLVTDLIPDGMAYIVDSVVTMPASTNIIMAPVTNITPNAGMLGNDGQNVTVEYLGNTLVYPVTNALEAHLRIRLDAIVLDTNSNAGLPPQTILTNQATITYSGNPQPPRISNFTTNTVIEPQLDITKTINIPSGDAGDIAVITLVVTNSGLATAYNLSFDDSVNGEYFNIASITNEAIPEGFTFLVVTNAPDATVIYSSDPTSGQPTNTLEASESLTFEFSMQLAQTVEPDQLLTNIASVAVAETIDGTNIYNVTRDESGAWDDASLVVSNMFIAKAFIGTSENGPADTTGTNVTIGESVTYRLTATLPESTITNLTLTDRIPIGMSYVPGSVSVDTTGFNGSLPGAPTVTTGGGSGDDVAFEFEGLTVVTADGSGANNSFTVDFELVVLDIAANVGLPGSQTILPDTAEISYDVYPPADTSTVVNVQVAEPLLDITKQMYGPSNDLVWLDLVVTNNGLSTAFDIEITDLFPASWWQTATLAGTAPTGYVFSITNAPGDGYLTILSDTNVLQPTNCIEVGSSVTFSFWGALQPGMEGVLTNEAVVSQYTTVDGTNANERFEPQTNDIDELPLPSFDIVKTRTIPASRAVTPGETVQFAITITNTGHHGFSTVSVTDTYDSVYLSFDSAVPPVDTTVAGTLSWTNVGPLDIGSVTTVLVNFTALLSTYPGDTTNWTIGATVTTNDWPVPAKTNSATVPIINAGYTIDKSLTSPLGRAAQVGEAITFNLTIVNTANVQLVTLPLEDVFDDSYLDFDSAVPPVDSSGAGTLLWNDVGPLNGGSTTTLVVNFTAHATTLSLPETNTIVASPTTASNMPDVPVKSNEAPYEISQAAYLLTKTRTAPAGRAAIIGESVVFNLTVENTGDVQLVTVPVMDTFDDSYLNFASAVPPESSNDTGIIYWDDVGPLAAGSTTTLVVNFSAEATTLTLPETNIVETAPTTPVDEPNVDPQTNEAPYAISIVGYTLDKTLTSPVGRAAQVGETITFNLTLVNTGEVELTTTPVIDTFDDGYLDFDSSVPPASSNASGIIYWDDAGTVPSGSSTTLVLNFTAQASTLSLPETNTVESAPTTPPDQPNVDPKTNEAPYEISSAGYLLTKTNTSPGPGNSARVGDTITFNVTIENTGDVNLVTVPVDDSFDSTYLSFASAVPTEDSTGVGGITWNDVGPLPVGSSTTLVVNFTALATTASLPETNTVETAPTTPADEPNVPPATNDAPYEISSPGYTIVKTNVDPGPANAQQVSQTITFNLTINNTGDVSLVTVPVTDTFDDSYLDFGSAVPPASSNDTGIIWWDDVGPVAVGSSTTIVLNMTAQQSTLSLPETNTVETAPTTPPSDPPVPTKTNEAPYEISEAGYSIVKTLTSPLGRAAQVGETISFELLITNTGEVILVTTPVIDTFDDSYLDFDSAVPPVSSNDTGILYWDDAGTIPVGSSTTLVVNFTAQATTLSLPETNIVETMPTTPPDEPNVPPKTNDAPYEISSAGYTIDKTLTSPAGRAAQVGETITFELLITNTGDVQLVTTPVIDTFDDGYLDYNSAVPPVSSNDTGILYWDDAGVVPVGSTTTLVVNFTAQATTLSLPETNIVETAPTTPPDEPTVDPKTNEAPYEISQAAFEVEKVLTSPLGRAAQVGETITFNLSVTNSGDVAFVTTPVFDTFDDSYLDFDSAVPAASSNDTGIIWWDDIGALPVGSVTTIVVNFTAQSSTLSLPETNNVVSGPTTPPDEPDLPPKTNDAPYEISAAGYTLDKTLTAPLGRAAQVGETITFELLITNTGDVPLVTAPVIDTFDDSYLDFSTAVPPVSSNDTGILYWDDAGTIPAGSSTTLVVNFTAQASTLSLPETNIVETSPTTPPDEPNVEPKTNEAPYEISSAGYTLDKTLTAPLGRAAQVGEIITFELLITNTGDVQLATTPVIDTFDDGYLDFDSAVPPISSNNTGILYWDDAGAIPVGSTTTLVVNFTAQTTTLSLPETNIVETMPTTPPDEPNVDPKTNEAPYEISSAGYTLVKNRTSPIGRAAQVGEIITFEFLITNTGDVQLVTIPIIDAFDGTHLSYTSAVPPADSADSVTALWNDVGPLDAGSSTTIVVNFTALQSTLGLEFTNMVFTTPTTPPDEPNVPERTNDAPYEISQVAFEVEKILTSPLGRAAQVGETITFNLSVTNAGDVAFVSTPVFDTFDDSYLDFDSAVPAASSNDTGIIWWDDIGTLPVGSVTTIVVNFTAQSSTLGLPETNTVVSGPTTPPDEPDLPPKTNEAPYEISAAGYTIDKTLSAPLGRAAQVGETITFELLITNTGDVQLVTTPVIDTFDDGYLDFSTAVPPVSSNETGILYWDDAGTIPVGSSTTLVVYFTAQASTLSLPETNIVETSPTTPPDEPHVDPKTNEALYEISAAGYTINKTLTAPLGRAAQVGETITFELLITNTGDVQLVTVPVNDTFDDGYLDYDSAVPPADSSSLGSLAWNDVGPIPVGSTTTLVVNFTAQASTLSLPETNTVATTPTTPPDEPNVPPKTNEAPYEISAAGYTIDKTLTAPLGRAAQVGETITFELLITNTGDVQLVTTPVIDTFDDSYLDFSTAVPPVSSNDTGILYWNDAGTIPVGSTTTLVVNFTAQASTLSLPETNIVETSPTTPPDEPNVDPKTNEAPYEISAAGYTIDKTLTAPLGRAAQVGETITFELLITNTGDVQLVTTPVIDTFDDSYLDFSTSVPPVSSNDTGILYWDDAGTIPVGSSTTLVVNFTAQASTLSLPETNIVETAPTTPPDEPNVDPKTNEAPYEISQAAFAVEKVLTSPLGRAAQVGETITFNLSVTNSGDVAFVTTPVFDTFDDSYLNFDSAVPAASSNDTGMIWWDDVGALPVGSITTIVVNFTAEQTTLSLPETNAVVAGPTTPPDEPDLPPKTNDTPYEISSAGYNIDKILTAPLGRAAQVGETVTFELLITNTGDVQLVTTPVIDTFDDSYLDFSTSVPPVSSNDTGILYWDDAGMIPVGSSTTLVVNFTAQASTLSLPETNTVETSPTTPPDEPNVPRKTNEAPYEISAAGYTIDKTLTAPLGRAVQVGETITFELLITNTGDVQFVTVPVNDTFDDSYLNYGSAVPPVDSSGLGTLTWNDVGPIPVGSTTTLVVNFTAQASTLSLPETNTVETTPTTPPDEPNVDPKTNEAPYEISAAGYTIDKNLTAPLGRAAQVGETITFELLITNTGDVQLVTVPVSDSFDDSYLDYVSAIPPIDSSALGVLTWNDVGPVPVGSTTTLVVNFTAQASTLSLPETNTVETTPTTPPDEPVVPPKTNEAPYAISAAGYTVEKTLFSPTNRIPQVGEIITFEVLITNTGDVQLVTVPVIDTFDDSYLDYSSAVPPADISALGSLTWNDVGPIPVGSSTNLTLNFTAQASTLGLPETNVVEASPTTPPDEPNVPPKTNDAPYRINNAGFDLTKTLISPTNRPAIIGESVEFMINVVNTGDVTLARVALLDIYDTTYLQYDSSIPVIDLGLPGFLTWNNVGPLDVGSDTNIYVTFTAIASTAVNPETNRAYAAGFVSTNEPPIDEKTSSVPYIVDAPCSLGDFVWNDLNANGIQDPGEPGIPLVEVSLYDGSGIFITNTFTDGSGLYSFTNLVPGTFIVGVDLLSGYSFSPPHQGGDMSRDSDVNPLTGRTDPIILNPGMDRLDIDAGMHQAGALAGTVYNDVNDDGTQQVSEVSFANVTVVLYDNGTGLPVATNVTDSLGNYLFTGLVPGDYYVDVLESTVPAGFTLGSHFTDPSGVHTVLGGQRVDDVDFAYLNNSPTTALVGDYVWSDTNGDGIQDPSESGIENVELLLIAPGPDGIFGTADDIVMDNTFTDSAGAYMFTNVTPGEYIIQTVDGPGTPLENLTEVSGPQSYPGVTTPFTLAAGDALLTCDFGYTGLLGSIGNLVFLDANLDGSFDSGDSGIPGVTVELRTTNGVVLATAITDASGNYSFDGLPGGNYVVVVTDNDSVLNGLTHSLGTPDTDNESQVIPYNVTLPDGGTITYADFGYGPQPGTIGDQVFHDVNADGLYDPAAGDAGIQGVDVNLYDADTNLLLTATTDTHGRYLFTDLPPGTYLVQVDGTTVPSGFTVGPLGPTPGANNNSQQQPYTIVLGAGDANVTGDFGYILSGAFDLSGTIFYDCNSNGVQDVLETGVATIEVQLYLDVNGDQQITPLDVLLQSLITTPDGTYAFGNLPAQDYILRLQDPNGMLQDTEQTIPGRVNPQPIALSASETNINFGYVRQAELGTIGYYVWMDINGDGLPDEDLTVFGLNDATVQLYQVEGGMTNFLAETVSVTGPSSNKGYYVFANLRSGDYLLRVVRDSIPPRLNVDTTPLEYPVTLCVYNNFVFGAGHFGFMPPSTPVTLARFIAEGREAYIQVIWETGVELENLGFNLYRSTSLDGEQVPLNSELIRGLGTSEGQTYEWSDGAVMPDVTYYYWLEDVSWSMETTLHGPASAHLENGEEYEELGSFSLEQTGLHRITYEALDKAGLNPAAMPTDEIEVLLGGQPVDATVWADGAYLQPGDFILFYVTPDKDTSDCAVALTDDARRMELVSARLSRIAGETGMYNADDSEVFYVDIMTNVVRYFISDFTEQPVWMLDVSDDDAQKLLHSYSYVAADNDMTAVYMSYFPESGTGQCVAVGNRAVINVYDIQRK